MNGLVSMSLDGINFLCALCTVAWKHEKFVLTNLLNLLVVLQTVPNLLVFEILLIVYIGVDRTHYWQEFLSSVKFIYTSRIRRGKYFMTTTEKNNKIKLHMVEIV